MTKGWVKVYRQFLESSTWRNHNLSRFWIWCLLKASHSSVKTRVRYTEVELSPGQFVFGRPKAAEETGLPEDVIRTCVKTLKADKTIAVTNHFTRQFSILTVLNWEGYQSEEFKNPRPFTRDPPTCPQGDPTNKNDQEEFVCDPAESPIAIFEGQFDPRRREILSAWKERMEKSGLGTAITPRDKATASAVLLAIDAGDYTVEQLCKGMDELMADPIWRHRYSFQGFVNDLPRWINRGSENDDNTSRQNGSGQNTHGTTSQGGRPKGKYAHIDAENFGDG